MLSRETRFGLTFGQIIALLMMIGAMVATYTDLNVRIATVEEKHKQLEAHINSSDQKLEVVRVENRQDHKQLEQKLDLLLEKTIKK
jgi:mannose/fructose/N-acetylgalactosamine-specific phosphotransferase system component IID